MKNLTIRIEGTTPLLMHAFTDAAQLAATNGTRGSSAASERGDAYEQAAAHLYLAADGETIIMPQPNLFSCLVAAGKFHKIGKSKVTTLKTSLLPACIAFDEVEYPLEHKGWSVDTRAVRIPATGGRIQRYRPIFETWAITFGLSLDTSEMTERLLRQIVDDAGRKIGLGDFRPECKGPFGRFVVTKWAEAEEEMPLAA